MSLDGTLDPVDALIFRVCVLRRSHGTVRLGCHFIWMYLS